MTVGKGRSLSQPYTVPVLGQKDFETFRSYLYAELGLSIAPSKLGMLQARLQKRLRALEMQSFKEYARHLFSESGKASEFPHLADVVTTNTTEFFREAKHFDYLITRLLPQWVADNSGKVFSVWSAGCSSGEEPYTLAMLLSQYSDQCRGFNFTVLATDISCAMLEKAIRAVYPDDRIAKIPPEMRKKYLLRSKDPRKELVRIAPEVRSMVRFRRLNFMETFDLGERLEVIFCRNVLIYFDRPTQEKLIRKFCTHLGKGGHLFIGHSESLAGMSLPLKQMAPAIYRKV